MPNRRRKNTPNDSGQLFFNESISERRRQLGITQQAAADKLFVALKTYQNWENQQAVPAGIEMMYAVCSLLDCDIDYLFGKQALPNKENTDIQEKTGLTSEAIDVLLQLGPIAAHFLSLLLVSPHFKEMLKYLDIAMESRLSTESLVSNFSDFFPEDYLKRTESDFFHEMDKHLRDLSKTSNSVVLSREQAEKFYIQEAVNQARLAIYGAMEKEEE